MLSIAFCLFISQSIFLSICPFSSIFVARLLSWKHKSILYPNTLYFIWMFSPSNELSIFVNNDCSLVKMTSFCLNPNPNLCATVFLQSMISLTANSLSIPVLLACFFSSSISSYLYFLWSERYFYVATCKFLWSNISSIWFSYNHNVPLLSAIVSTSFFQMFFCLCQQFFYSSFHRNFRILDFLFHFIIFS